MDYASPATEIMPLFDADRVQPTIDGLINVANYFPLSPIDYRNVLNVIGMLMEVRDREYPCVDFGDGPTEPSPPVAD